MIAKECTIGADSLSIIYTNDLQFSLMKATELFFMYLVVLDVLLILRLLMMHGILICLLVLWLIGVSNLHLVLELIC